MIFPRGKSDNHYAMIGMAHIADGFPLFYDAANEKGLCMAGLNFVGNARYAEPTNGKVNVAQYEFIPFVLANCASVKEAEKLLFDINLTGTPFSEKLPAAQLHWMIADSERCITVESRADGFKVFDNPAGVLTNNPPFEQQLFSLNNYMNLSAPRPPKPFFRKARSRKIQQGHGRLGASRRPFLLFPFCAGGIYTAEFGFGRKRGAKREPVFPYSRLGGAGQRML